MKRSYVWKARRLANAIRDGYPSQAGELMRLVTDGKVTYEEAGIDQTTVEDALQTYISTQFRPRVH